MSFETLASEVLFRGRVLTLRRDEVQMSDGVAVREVVEHPGAVAIVALDDDGRVVLVRQYRHPVGHELDELPAGLLDVDGEPALVGAQRELHEEAALRADRWDVLTDFYTSPGMSTEAIRVYLARDLHDVGEHERFDGEHEEATMTVERRPLDDAVADVFTGRINNGIAVAGLLAAARARDTGFVGLRPADAPWAAKPDRAGP